MPTKRLGQNVESITPNKMPPSESCCLILGGTVPNDMHREFHSHILMILMSLSIFEKYTAKPKTLPPTVGIASLRSLMHQLHLINSQKDVKKAVYGIYYILKSSQFLSNSIVFIVLCHHCFCI
jgi:hypothetical protein